MKTNFKDFLAQSTLNESFQGINDYNIGYVIPYSLHMVSQVHLWHLLCPDGQKHMALGLLYEGIQEKVDGLAEKFIAQGGILLNVDVNLSTIYTVGDVIDGLQRYRELIENSMTTRTDMASINDGLIDLQEVIDENLFKFQLN